MFSNKKVRLIDIARVIERDKSTIIRWEELGLIPQAKRDSRGWRFYSEEEAKHIVDRVHATHYFKNTETRLADGVAVRPQRMVYIGVLIGVLLMSSQLFTLGYRVFAATANSNFFTTITAGTLAISSASTSDSFAGVGVSFVSQTATLAKFGATNIQDPRGSGAGWTLALSGTDWNELNNNAPGGRIAQLDYDGTGSDGNLGKMCLIVASGAIRSQAGQDTTNITKGSLTCFSGTVSSISIYVAGAGSGKGNYWVTDFSLEQFIPSNPTAQNLTTTLTLTLT